MGQPHCMVANAGCKEAGEKTSVESVKSHDRRAHSAQLLYQPVRLPESSRRTMAQDYPKPKPQGRYFATAGALPTKRGTQF